MRVGFLKLKFIDVRKAHRGWKRLSVSLMDGDWKFENYEKATLKGGYLCNHDCLHVLLSRGQFGHTLIGSYQ